MTEAKWLACEDPDTMLAFLRGKMSNRKLRLFAVACCRIAWSELSEVGRNAVIVAESYADKNATRRELDDARKKSRDAWFVSGADNRSTRGWRVAEWNNWEAATGAVLAASLWFPRPAYMRMMKSKRPKPAMQMYDSRDFSAMPILADALQDAGCDNGDILDHCRGLGPHVRGCWVVDKLLSKE